MLVFCMFRVRLKNHNIFLACSMGHIFVKHCSVGPNFAKDATNFFE